MAPAQGRPGRNAQRCAHGIGCGSRGQEGCGDRGAPWQVARVAARLQDRSRTGLRRESSLQSVNRLSDRSRGGRTGQFGRLSHGGDRNGQNQTQNQMSACAAA
ncbi:hypothetical protein AA103196_0128 [Ameyamaea chiangmaiensis NBRC 103196]|nr:hypothetical protein AA103196_0128 [Ameyamaea chiangmaiensis NBRC 103196]